MPKKRTDWSQLTMNPVADPGVEGRAGELFRDQCRQIHERTDRWFVLLMLVQWVAGIILALVVSPRTWAGSISHTHIHVWAAIFLGGAISSGPIYLVRRRPGTALTRQVIAGAQMLWSGLFIHLTGGRIETHFHVFGSLAFLAFYRDWRVFISATLVVGVDHLVRGIFWPQSVYGVLSATPWRSLEHAGWVIFENIFLVRSCRQSVVEMWDTARQRARLERTNELVEEEIAHRTEELRVRKFALEQHAIVSEADALGRINYVSDTFCRISGYSREELLGRDHRILNSGYHPRAFWKEMYAALARDGVWQGEVCNRAKDGSLYWVYSTNVASKDAEGRIAGYVSMRVDITGQKQAEQRLRKQTTALEWANETLAAARREAETANRAKSQFLANMSHEIRTPMNGIIGMTELVLDSELTAQQHEYLSTVRECAYSLLNLLNGILDLSKIEAGKLELETTNFDLISTVEDALEVMSHRAAEKGLELICSIDPATPRFVYGDPLRLRQVLLNLLGNALKFTEEGEVVVGTQVEETTEEGVTLRFFVTDTGIGIPQERISAVFESFTQADGTTTRKFGGTGLGLTISRQIVELMGGVLWAESEPGKGSTFAFRVTLPCDEPTPQTGDLRPLSESGIISSIADKRILVVDDNATNRCVLQLILESWGCQTVVASGGNEALHVLRTGQSAGRPFDVLLLDVQMPEMDGLTVARNIANHTAFGRPKIVFLSSVGNRSDIDPGKSTPCDACLTKPVKQSLLMDTLVGLFGENLDRMGGPGTFKPGARFSGRARRDVVTPDRKDLGHLWETPPPAALSDASARLSPSVVRVLLVEDNAVNRRVASGILRKFCCTVTEAENGRAALEILEANGFDLVFMDLQMPVMDGFETTAAIRADARWKDLPIIAMTAHAMKGDRERCLAAGMNDYAAKPVRFEEIRGVIEKWACRLQPSEAPLLVGGASGREAASRRPQGATLQAVIPGGGLEMNHSSKPPTDTPDAAATIAPTSPDLSARSPVDLAMALTNLAGDDELFREVLAAFVEGLPQQFEQFQEACARADIQRLRALAHTLKGSASNVCAEQTLRLARRIEELSTEGGIEAVAALLPELKDEVDKLRAFAATLVKQV